MGKMWRGNRECWIVKNAREKRNIIYVEIEKARHEGDITWFSLLSKT